MKYQFTKLNRPTLISMLVGVPWKVILESVSKWKEGQEGTLEIKKKSKPKSRQQLGYYYAVILPEAVKAFCVNEDFSLMIDHKGRRLELELTLDNMDMFLKTAYAKATGKYVNKSEMDMAECSAYEDWCIKWLKTWLGCNIPEADANWREK